MLADDVDALTARIAKLATDEVIANRAKGFGTRASQIDQLADALHPATDRVELLRNNGVKISVPSPPSGITSFAEDMKRSLEKDPASVVSDTGGFGQKFKTPLEDFVVRLEGTLTSEWKKHVHQNAPEVRDDLLSILAKVKGFAASVSVVKERLARYREHRAKTPNTLDDVSSFNRARDDLRETLRSVGSDELPPEIVKFMGRAGLEGVPLDELSAETRDWLVEHELLAHFVIRTG